MKARASSSKAVQGYCACCLVAALTLALVYLPGCRQSESNFSSSDFTLPQVRGGVFHSRAAEHRRALLLAFLQTVPDTANSPSHEQAGFLLSMQHQYGACGLEVAVIDATGLLTGEAPTRDALLNASYDWRLGGRLLQDDENRVAKRWGVTRVPTMMLLASDGSVAQRWNGLTGPAMLAQSVEKLCGGRFGENSR